MGPCRRSRDQVVETLLTAWLGVFPDPQDNVGQSESVRNVSKPTPFKHSAKFLY